MSSLAADLNYIVSSSLKTRRMCMQKLTCVNVWQNTTLCDCDMSEQLVQLLIISDGELKMTGDDTCLLVVACCVAGQFEDFSCEVF
jgi:hypothetical protein